MWALVGIGMVVLVPSGVLAVLIGQLQVGSGLLVMGALLGLIIGVRAWLERFEDAARREADRVAKSDKERQGATSARCDPALE